jgi:hypothetical protein
MTREAYPQKSQRQPDTSGLPRCPQRRSARGGGPRLRPLIRPGWFSGAESLLESYVTTAVQVQRIEAALRKAPPAGGRPGGHAGVAAAADAINEARQAHARGRRPTRRLTKRRPRRAEKLEAVAQDEVNRQRRGSLGLNGNA